MGKKKEKMALKKLFETINKKDETKDVTTLIQNLHQDITYISQMLKILIQKIEINSMSHPQMPQHHNIPLPLFPLNVNKPPI